ncbi:sulfurtransferase [Streptomyces sp. NPDC005373]|uniref:sulfurtransferase n=1 Tax=Streptomyces sp. NPDC005373 TaxID=3156879 RepID=UPI00339FCEA0
MSATLRTSRNGEVAVGLPGFISVDELAALVQHGAPILLLDVRFTLEKGPLPEEYLAGHIPGAVFVDLERELSGPRLPAVGSYPVPEPCVFERTARSWGLSSDTEVVVYAGYTGISAGRLAWLLRWFGHERVRILDGGLQAWKHRGYPLIREWSTPEASGTFRARPSSVPVVDIEGVLQLGRRRRLIDVRARSQYRLSTPDPQRGGRPPGRIPGAVNVPSTSLHQRNGRLRSAQGIAGLLAAQGVDVRRPVAVYCGGGVASAWAAFALRAAGVDAAFFAASWSEYVADPSLPVEVEQTQ